VVSGEISHLALHWLFGGSKWSFSVTRCKHHLIFRTPLRAVAGALAHLFGPTSPGCTAKGGVSTSTTCSVAVIEVHQPKLLSFGLNFAPTAYPRTDLRRSVQGSVCRFLLLYAQLYVHVVCDRSIWVAGISISHELVPTNKSDLRGERARGYSRR
jgi:hypothetical protein